LIYTVSFCLQAVGEWDPTPSHGLAYGFALAIFAFLGPLDWIDKALFNGNGFWRDNFGFSLKLSIFLTGWDKSGLYHCRISGIERISPEAIFHPENRNIFDRARHLGFILPGSSTGLSAGGILSLDSRDAARHVSSSVLAQWP